MNAPDQQREKDRIAKAPVDATNQDGGNILRRERRGGLLRADERRDCPAREQTRIGSNLSQD